MNTYGLPFKPGNASEIESQLLIEMEAIRRGGVWNGGGLGLAAHFKNAANILWPQIDWHRWTELVNKEIRRPNAKITTLMGAGSTGKTAMAAWEFLLEYYCRPHDTLVLVSSTDLRGLELRVWGEIKMRHEQAIEKFPWLPGHLIDSKHCICTDDLSDGDIDERVIRDLRKGIIGIPCLQNGKFVGLKNYVGAKQKHIRLLADEAQFMGASFLKAFTNLNNNVDFQACVMGNPVDELDSLGIAAEPKDGWAAHMEPERTAVWDTKFFNGRCINLVGTDSPNFDDTENPERYPYLISQPKIDETASFYHQDSVEYYSQCKGVMKVSTIQKRVLTRNICSKFNAGGTLEWDGTVKRIGMLDAAYGGDRCALSHLEFGKCVDGKTRIKLFPITTLAIRVKTRDNLEAEEQIAHAVKDYCSSRNIPPEHFFHDSTGRGSLGTALSRIWSPNCNPVEFGGSPTSRPVSDDLFIFDKHSSSKRLKRCDEHYSKFVTELWFSVRYCVESDQLRGLPDDAMDEFCMREWRMVKGDKRELESKEEMKERARRSPDLADCIAIGIEGARRRGFLISKLGLSIAATSNKPDWLTQQADDWKKFQKNRQLKTA